MDIYSDFLSPEEIFVLTDRKQPKKQIEQLNLQGIPFVLTGKERPIVRRDYNQTPARKQNTAKKTNVEWRSNALKT